VRGRVECAVGDRVEVGFGLAAVGYATFLGGKDKDKERETDRQKGRGDWL
jgi:hypothetical protein